MVQLIDVVDLGQIQGGPVGINITGVRLDLEDPIGAVIDHGREAFPVRALDGGDLLQQTIELTHDFAQFILPGIDQGQRDGILRVHGSGIEMVAQMQ